MTAEGLAELDSLERSIRRRQMRASALRKRRNELGSLLAEAESELATVEMEIAGAREAGALLIEEVIDQVRRDHNEGWSPTPIRGFRVWRIEDNAVLGNQMRWVTETMESECLQDVPGDDVPHSIRKCGPPPCGIYAVKDLDRFPAELAAGNVSRSVVGVVAMTGKVIEHDLGFRAQSAAAVALLVNFDGQRTLLTEASPITDFFADPTATLGAISETRPNQHVSRASLESIQRKEESWI